MSILETVYKMSASVSSANDYLFPLVTPKEVFFTLNFDNQPKDTDNATIFWNFDDPHSVDNETINYSAINSVTSHTFQNAGVYNVTNISNINGTQFHLNKLTIIPPDSGDGYAVVPASGSFAASALVKIYSYDKFAKITYSFDNIIWHDYSNGILVTTTTLLFFIIKFSDGIESSGFASYTIT